MKIIILYTYNKGYLSQFFFELCSMLSANGHEVITFSLKRKASKNKINNVEVIIKKRGGYISTYFQIFRLLKNNRADVVLSNFSYANPALLFGKLLGVKNNMVWFHSLNEQMTPTWSNIFIKRQFLRLANKIIANSQLTEKELKEIYKVPSFKIETIPFWSNIADQSNLEMNAKFKKMTNVFNIGCPGRMVLDKNHKVVIEALSLIYLKTDFDFHLYFAGDGIEMNPLILLSEQLNLKEKMSFCGHLSAEEMTSFYKAMDVVVLPSFHEAFGLVFIEALALGTPVLVSSQFGALDFIDTTKFDLKKFSFDPNSKEGLAKKLKEIMTHGDLGRDFYNHLYDDTFDKYTIFHKIRLIVTSSEGL